MRSGRLLLIIGLVLVLGAVAVGAFMMLKPSPAPPPAAEQASGTPTPTPLPPDMVEVVISAQNIPRGTVIKEEDMAVMTHLFPKDLLVEGTVTDLEDVYGRTARVEIPRGMPILESMLTEIPGQLAAEGSDAAIQIPEGKVAYAMPVGRYSSIAWALQPGDHVDVIISLLLVEMDEEFQTPLQNKAEWCMNPLSEENKDCQSGVFGRMDMLPNGWLVRYIPNGGQWPQLITQLTVQDVLVLQVGDWPEVSPEQQEMAMAEEEAPPPEEQPPEEGQQEQATRPEVQPVTIVVTPQEAMILDYLQSIGARINLVMRSAADAQSGRRFTTEAVTLNYLMNRYDISYPTKLPYGVTPPISKLERIARNETAAQYGAQNAPGGE